MLTTGVGICSGQEGAAPAGQVRCAGCKRRERCGAQGHREETEESEPKGEEEAAFLRRRTETKACLC